jgi:hypothetical protein
MKRWMPVVGAVVGLALGFAIGWVLAANDIAQLGDWRAGAQRFIGMTSAIGAFLGFFVAIRLTRGKHVTRDGFTLSYNRIEPKAAGYRDLVTITVADVLAGLREVGYAPRAEGCSVDGERSKVPLDPTTPIAGTNVAFVDPGVRGWIRLQLPIPVDGQPRALGLLELWSERGDSTEEFGLFTLRILDTLVGNMSASRESSQLSQDPIALVTAGLAERPVHRAA